MKLNELIKKTNFDEVWVKLKKAYDIPDKIKLVYRGVVYELKEISIENPTNLDEVFTIGVCELEDVLEPGTLVFDVFGISHDNSGRYSLMFAPWSNWLSYDILDKSIDIYGETVVLAHILYEMTFNGYSSHDTEQKQQKIIEKLDEAQKSIDDGYASLVYPEEVYAALGLARDRDVDPELEKTKSEATEAAMARNELRLQELMSDWRGRY
jgi:hypothetical protein